MTELGKTLIGGATIVALLFLAWFVWYRLACRWKKQFVERTRQLKSDLERLRADLSRTEREAQQYPPGDPEPYGPVARDLHRRLGQIRTAYAACTRQRSQLYRQVPTPPENRVRRLWFSLVPEFYHWRQLHLESGSLQASAQALGVQARDARRLLAELKRMPLTVARRCQDLHQVSEQTLPLAQALYEAGVRGQTLDAAAAQVKQLQGTLKELPDWCFQETVPTRTWGRILRQASKESTIGAWRTLEQVAGPIRGHSAAFQRWRSQYQDAGKTLRAMWLALGVARQSLSQVPHSLDVDIQVLGLEQLNVLAQELETRYQAPTIENLGPLHDGAQQVATSADQLAESCASLTRDFERLRGTLSSNADLLDTIKARMDEAAPAHRYPIDWGPCRTRLTRLRQVQADIGAIAARRTPERLQQHVVLADELADVGRTLEREVSEAQAQREELLPLLERPELAANAAWLKRAQDLQGQARPYASANWPREHAIQGILSDAHNLSKRRQQWVPARANDPLSVAGLERQLDEVKKLVADLEAFQQRLQQVAERLALVQEAEQAAQQGLQLACEAVERLLARTRSARPQLDPAAARQQGQLERAQYDGRALLSELKRQSAGRVEDKAAHAENWLASCEKTLHALSRALQAESKGLEAELGDEVNELRRLAPFEGERAMREAQVLLGAARPTGSSPAGRGDSLAARIESLADRAAKVLQDRESLHASLDNLRSQIRDRINNPLETCDETRQQALARFDELRALKARSEADWPPLLCDTRWAQDLLDNARRDREALQRSGGTVSNVVHILRRVVQRYEDLIARVPAEGERNQRERRNLQAPLDRLERWRGQLEAYRDAHRQEREVAEAVQARLDEIDSAIDRAKRHHRRRPLTYEGARQVLQSLWSLAHDRDLPIRGSRERVKIRDIEAEFPT